MSLSAEEKKRIMRALEEDREFRYALAGLLGYKEILDRITSLDLRRGSLSSRRSSPGWKRGRPGLRRR